MQKVRWKSRPPIHCTFTGTWRNSWEWISLLFFKRALSDIWFLWLFGNWIILLTLHRSEQRWSPRLHQPYAIPSSRCLSRPFISTDTAGRVLQLTHNELSATAVLAACCWVRFLILMKLKPDTHLRCSVRAGGREGDLAHVWQPTVEREMLSRWCYQRHSLPHPPHM